MVSTKASALIVLAACASVAPSASARSPSAGRAVVWGGRGNSDATASDRLRALEVRGGASKTRRKTKGKRTASLSSLSSGEKTATGRKKVGAASKEKKSALGDTMQKYKAILPLTRVYITMVGVTTFLGMVLGEELAQGLLALDPIRTIYGMELWRPLTAACFLGPPSIGWLMSAYYLFEYGSSLERAYGTAQHLVFLLGQVGLLSIFSVLIGQPFFAPSVITAMLHVLSRSVPHQKVKWLIFNVPYWTLPYGLMASDVLQAQSPAAAVPHVMGILSGHFYFFHKFVWPKMGGEDWLTAPEFLSRRLDPNSRDEGRKSVEAALKGRKKGKGRKLGGK
uniref:Derlin n=1 Tax=Trieres chinensis TaxID=1514140 RepID=A0A7S2EIA0_TRICV|mmetsp:Transcript_250/g.578  ORF Transcript_250/g.578 Transcript_250/m.578 type:complete len:337 (+) Transcript_250:115-1125(+)